MSSAQPAVPAVVERARVFVRPALAQAIARFPAGLERAAGYYFGWWDADGSPVAGRGSRSLQACMAMLSAEAAGAEAEVALPGAVAVELIHNFSLLHDDIIDGDDIRRGRPTAWVVYGTGTSLLSGDALWAAAAEGLFAVDGPAGAAAARELNNALTRMIHAAARECEFDDGPVDSLSIDDYLHVCEGKGGALLGSAAVIGSVLAGAPAAQAEVLREAAHRAGTAWQAANDLENIWGDTVLVGKPGFQDLRSRKRTLPVIAALQSGHPASDELACLLKGDLDEDGLARAASLIDAAGGRAYAQEVARSHLAQAVALLDGAALPPAVHEDLVDLLDFAVTRRPRTGGRGGHGGHGTAAP
ncbi:polyprenyl synthetase family protein [Streptomyces sp. SCSIO 30461]|uniref:polyprenyl synthetase family protein n=1 Tax=Streptomyces sp. SCSIO 30461 TaxID=3118085 RepID=UPI0030D4A2E0